MDLEDWELLPKKNYKGIDLDLDLGHEEDQEAIKMIRSTGKSFDMDYFIYPPIGKTELYQKSSVVPTQLLQVPTTWEPVSTVEPDPDVIPSPRITFTKTKETEFVDMKIDSSEMFTSTLPQNDERHSKSEGRLGGEYCDENMRSGSDDEEEGDDLRSKRDKSIVSERMNLWKKSLNGIGAICSFGVAAAAATICVFVLGQNNNNIQGSRNKNQILRFQIYSDDNKRMNEVVKRATKMNEAISVMKSLPVARAQISFGGYYDEHI